jgi:hypothetical protein
MSPDHRSSRHNSRKRKSKPPSTMRKRPPPNGGIMSPKTYFGDKIRRDKMRQNCRPESPQRKFNGHNTLPASSRSAPADGADICRQKLVLATKFPTQHHPPNPPTHTHSLPNLFTAHCPLPTLPSPPTLAQGCPQPLGVLGGSSHLCSPPTNPTAAASSTRDFPQPGKTTILGAKRLGSLPGRREPLKQTSAPPVQPGTRPRCPANSAAEPKSTAILSRKSRPPRSLSPGQKTRRNSLAFVMNTDTLSTRTQLTRTRHRAGPPGRHTPPFPAVLAHVALTSQIRPERPQRR